MKQKLATTTSITSTYAGEFAGEYISAMLLAGQTLGNNTITIKPNVKYKEVVKKGVTASLLAAATCDFSDTGSVTLTERIIEPVELQVNLELCKKDFHSDWEAESMGFSAHDNMPPKFSDWLIDNVSKSVAASIETAIWQGSGAATTFSGFTTLLAADTDVVDITGTTVTAANVQAQLALVVAQLASLNTTESVIYAGKSIISNYLISLGGFGANGLGANGFKGEGPTGTGNAPLYYAGVEIVEAPGMPANQMIGAEARNLWFGTGLMNDQNEVKVLDMSDNDGSQNVRYVMRFTGAVQYGIGSEIVYYWS